MEVDTISSLIARKEKSFNSSDTLRGKRQEMRRREGSQRKSYSLAIAVEDKSFMKRKREQNQQRILRKTMRS